LREQKKILALLVVLKEADIHHEAKGAACFVAMYFEWLEVSEVLVVSAVIMSIIRSCINHRFFFFIGVVSLRVVRFHRISLDQAFSACGRAVFFVLLLDFIGLRVDFLVYGSSFSSASRSGLE